jgi:hypothetical protein
MRDHVRCPECPRTLPREEYARHMDLFHPVRDASGALVAPRPPLKPSAKAREAKVRDDDAPLWEDVG